MTAPSLTAFLDVLWGSGPHSLCAASAARPFHTVGVFATPADLLARAKALGPTSHIWFGVHALGTVPATGRGSEQDIVEIVSLIADLDWASEGAHKVEGLPSEDEVRAALARLGPELHPSIVVHSGHGLQAYWRLTHPLPADDGLELQARLSARLGELGLVNERNDLASVLRLPGSRNVKTATPVPVRIEVFEKLVYTPQYLAKRLPKVSGSFRRGPGTRHQAGPVTDGQRDLLEHVTEHYGAHSPMFGRDGSIHVVRPGKDFVEGTSASIIVGTHGDALFTVFSPSWPAVGPVPPDASKSWVLTPDGLQVAHEPVDPILLATAEEKEEEAEPPPSSSSSSSWDAADFFGSKGLRVRILARAVEDMGRLAAGTDGRLWRYRDGRWIEGGEAEVSRRVQGLLGNRYRVTHTSNVLDLFVKREPFITDAQPERWINVTNGLLDWRTGELHQHTSEIPSTYQLQVAWLPDATCPTVDAWLLDVVDADVVELIWEVVGMCVYAGDPFHRAVMLAGPGRNGKGTLLRLIRALIGARHVATVTLQALGEDRFMVAQLYGKVANLAGDLDARAVLRSDVFKMITGGDAITGQHKYRDPFSFVSRATMVFAANETPGAADHTLGYTSRWVIVPYRRRTLAPGEEDKTLEPRMHDELAGVLVRAVAGLRRAVGRGEYARPTSVEAETSTFSRNANPVRRFVDDCLEVTGMPHDDVARASVYGAYREWCKSEGHHPLGANRFWPQLVEADPQIDTGITADNRHGHRVGQTRIVKGIQSIYYVGMPP